LLYELRTIPDEYGMKTLKECEDVKVIEEKITIAMTVLGIIPGIYLFFKEVYWKIQEWVKNGFTFKKVVTPSEEGTPREKSVKSLSKRKVFESSMNLGSVSEVELGSGPEATIEGSMDSVESRQAPPLAVLQGYRGSVRVSTINSDEAPV
jgi:hypothetical protein